MGLPSGTILDGKFRIVQILGEGGMGTVYKVEQVNKPGFYRAVKELLIPLGTSEEERVLSIERFDREVDMLFGLKHECIPSLIVNFQERGNYYFVMEYVPGKSLEQILDESKSPLDERLVVDWMIHIADALQYIHSQNPPIILRDLKPGNIMVTPNNEVRLIDFGIARKFDARKRTNTENLGTISYASPEHLGSVSASGKPGQGPKKQVQTDARSDIYSFGATIYHLLTNTEPDPVHTPEQGSILAKNPKLHTVVMQEKRICPIEQVIIRAMQLNANDRYQTAKEMKMALHQSLVSISQTRQPKPIHQSSGQICPKCGFHNRNGARFCKIDGQALGSPIATHKQGVPAYSQPKPVVSIRVASPSSVVSRAEQAYTQGVQLLHAKRYDEAIRLLLQANHPGASAERIYEITYTLARAYRQGGIAWRAGNQARFIEYTKRAATQFQAATRYKPSFSAPWLQLGMCYRDIRQFAEAIYALQQAIRLAPQNLVSLYQLGKVYQDQNNTKQAELVFLEVLKRNRHHEHTLLALGQLYLTMGQTMLSIPLLQQAVSQSITMGEAWFVLGQAYIQGNKWQEALESLHRAFQYSTGNTSTISGAMALCYIRLNRKEEARKILNNAAHRDPDNKDLVRLQRLL